MSYPVLDFHDLRNSLRTLMRNRFYELDANKLYELADIVGRDWWNQFSGKQRQRIGAIGANLVRKKEVPFARFEKNTGDRHAQYFLASHNPDGVA